MEQNKFLNDSPEQVVIFPEPRRIRISNAIPARAYGLFDSETDTQVTGFKKGTDGQIEFNDLNPQKHYDVGAIESIGDEKPQFSIAWTYKMKDNTDEILKNSGNLPVEYPHPYVIIDNNNKNNVFNIVDNNDETVGQVMNLYQTGDKPEFVSISTFRMKDDTQK